MRVEIFRVPPRPGEWAQTTALYSFRPQTGDDRPVVVVEVPNDWLRVGQPEPLLVRRTSASGFMTRTATEVLYHADLGAEGFGLLDAQVGPGDGTPWDAIAPLIKPIPSPETPALPAPGTTRHGKAKPSARQSNRR